MHAAVSLAGLSPSDFTAELQLSFREAVASQVQAMDVSQVTIKSFAAARRGDLLVRFKVAASAATQSTISAALIAGVADAGADGFSAAFRNAAAARGITVPWTATLIVEDPSTSDSTTAPTSGDGGDGGSSMPMGVIIGGAVGAIAVVGLVGWLVYRYHAKRKAEPVEIPTAAALPHAMPHCAPTIAGKAVLAGYPIANPIAPPLTAEKIQVETLQGLPSFTVKVEDPEVIVESQAPTDSTPPPPYSSGSPGSFSNLFAGCASYREK